MVEQPLVLGAVLQRIHGWLLGPVTSVEVLLERTAWALGEAMSGVPVAVVAVTLGMVVWRGRRPGAGIVVALAVQVAALTYAWNSLLHTIALALVVALTGVPLRLLVSYGTRRLALRVPRPLRRPEVLGPLALVLLPLSLVAFTVATGGAGVLAMVVAAAAVAGVLVARGGGSSAWESGVITSLFSAFGVVVLGGLLGGPAIGGELARAVPTAELRVTADLSVALAAACCAFTAALWSPLADEDGSSTDRLLAAGGGEAAVDPLTPHEATSA